MTSPVETPNAVHGCIIMASGLGTRFGSNKLMADLDGAPLGLYVPADTALDESGMNGVEDLPDQERIWNSQTVTLMVCE